MESGRSNRKKNTKRNLLLALAVLAAAAVVFYAATRGVGSGKPSVLFIVVDTLRSDHLGCYGYARKTSPNIDRLASEGVLFKNNIAQSSWTLPSMISMMSGRYLFSKIPRFPSKTTSLAQYMKRNGYRTAGFVANALVGKNEGFDKGFDHFEIRRHKKPQWSGRDLNERLLSWMRSSLEEPFFLYVHYLDPHFPYEPPEGFASFEDDLDPIQGDKLHRIMELAGEKPDLAGKAESDLREMRRLIDAYDGEIRFVDQCVGEILQELARLGLANNTAVILTSDHGECLFDHRHYTKVVEKNVPEEKQNLTTWFFRDHGYHIFQELIRVPLIIRGPGIRGGRVVEGGVENVDLLPTLLSMAGSEEFSFCDGRNLLPFLQNPEESLAKKDIFFSHCDEATCAIQPKEGMKFVAPTKTGMWFGLDYTLFDLKKDPWEAKDRMRDIPKVSRRLLKAIENRRKIDYFKDKTGEVNEATRKKMEELGYAH